MRARLIAFALLFLSCTSAPAVVEPTPLATREPNTVSVSVLLDLSGPRAPSGQPQRNAMQIWLDRAQAAQDRTAVKLRVKFVDVGGSDAKLLLELRRAAVDDRADAVVVGVPIALDDTFARAVEIASVPVLLTLPAPEPAGSVGGGWTFALAPTPQTIARALVDDLVARGLLPPTLLAGDETAAAIAERAALAAEVGKRGGTVPTPIIVTQPDGAQRAKSAAAGARSVVLSGASEKYAELVRNMPIALDAPRVYLSYLTETADIASLRDQSALVTWPGSRNLATLSVTPLWPERSAFLRAFADRHGAPSTLAATAYDALAVLSAAAEQAPSELEAARLRLRLEALTFVGVVTRYSFTATRHAGFPPDDLAYLRWNARVGAPFLASEPKENPR